VCGSPPPPPPAPPRPRALVPPARMHATLTAVGDRLFLFGGTAPRVQPGGSHFLNDLFVFDVTRVQPTPYPHPRLAWTFGEEGFHRRNSSMCAQGAWSDELSRPFCCADNALVDALGPRPDPRTQHAAAAHGLCSRAHEPFGRHSPLPRVRAGSPGDAAKKVFVFGGMTDRIGFNGDPAARVCH
jgi:hypothetical protein